MGINTNIPKEQWRFPAHEFEKDTGITGIAANYTLPKMFDSLSAAFVFYAFLRDGVCNYPVCWRSKNLDDLPQRHAEILAFAEELIACNQGLDMVEFDRNDFEQVEAFIGGVLSGYSPDDIDHFFNNSDRDTYRAYLKLLRHKINYKIEWQPAPQTIKKIKNYFGIADWEPGAEMLADPEKYRRNLHVKKLHDDVVNADIRPNRHL